MLALTTNIARYKLFYHPYPVKTAGSIKTSKPLPVRSHTRALPGPTPTFRAMSGALRFAPPATPL